MRHKHLWVSLAFLVGLLAYGPSHCKAQTAQLSASDIYKKSSPAVVLIETYNLKGEVSGAGSGFLVTTDGVIITNFHVVEHTKRATVRLANQDAYDTVEVLDIDKRKDIALIKIKAVGLPYLTLGRSAPVEVGQSVFSLSNPLGALQNTLSQGIVSGVRQGDGYHYFQITAPISHRSSGSPVFNSAGEVIGIAVATLEEGQNLNFAIPVDYAKGMLSSNQPKPLESIYEPETEGTASTRTGTSAAPKSTASNELGPSATATPSDEMKKASFKYLEGKLGKWTDQDAVPELGSPVLLILKFVASRAEMLPSVTMLAGVWYVQVWLRLRRAVRHRFAYDDHQTIVSDIYAYPDPTRLMREFELGFDIKTKLLTGVYAYPWDMTWDQCKQFWGDNARTLRKPDGTRFRLYKDRHLNVYLDKSDKVISLGVY